MRQRHLGAIGVSTAPVTIRLAETADDFMAVKQLIKSYVEWLDRDLSFQAYDAEISNLPVKYRPPTAAMFLAQVNDLGVVGCGGFSPIALPGACETKRLFVDPRARGRGVAHALMCTVIRNAAAAGYREMFLDTLPTMTAALSLYQVLGFEPTGRYNDNPIAEAVFFRRRLSLTGD